MKDRVIAALDFPKAEDALRMADRLRGHVGAVKVGFELFVSAGPDFVRRLVGDGHKVFLDLKFHDIPNTVACAARAATRLGVWMLNVHASGGEAMMRAALDALREESEAVGKPRPLLIGVSVLTSLDEAALYEIGYYGTVRETVERLVKSAYESGLDGVVCSPHEAKGLKEIYGKEMLLVTPGVRPAWAEAQDQKRVMTPRDAMDAGADYLVVGRPITHAPDPAEAADRLFE